MDDAEYEAFLDAKQKRNEITHRDVKEPHEVCGNDCPWTLCSKGIDMGCLPSPVDFVERALQKGELLSCHNNYKIPCKGIKDFLALRGIDSSKMKITPND